MVVEFIEIICVIFVPIVTYFLYLLIFALIHLRRQIIERQKTRNPQRRRMYVGSRSRPSLTPAEPTIYVNPANLPPPPKYEALAPPSYDEVVGVHYPNYQPTQLQPITAPITTALAQGSSNSSSPPEYNEIPVPSAPPAIITVTSEERRPSVAVRS